MNDERVENGTLGKHLICLATASLQRHKSLKFGCSKEIREVRLRLGQPVYLQTGEGGLFLSRTGVLQRFPDSDSLLTDRESLEECFRAICGYAVHTHQNELKNGFVTLKGGHRAGICGTGVYHDGSLTAIRELSSVNIRVAHQIRGAADEILRRWDQLGGILLVGPPASGKTTILRDMARQLGSGYKGKIRKIALVDERGEIAASVGGYPQNDVGFCTDILNGISKKEGISMAVRTLSPHLIFCDEIGRESEVAPIVSAMASGVMMAGYCSWKKLRRFVPETGYCPPFTNGNVQCSSRFGYRRKCRNNQAMVRQGGN